MGRWRVFYPILRRGVQDFWSWKRKWKWTLVLGLMMEDEWVVCLFYVRPGCVKMLLFRIPWWYPGMALQF